MSINAIGAREPIRATINADVFNTAAITADGVARDLTDAVLSIIIQDDNQGCPKTIGSYPQEITDAAAGLFNFNIPKVAFTNLSGEEVSWNLVITENSIPISLALGTVLIEGIE